MILGSNWINFFIKGIELEERFGEYNKRGDYHKHLDPNWSYYPIYIRKISFIDNYLKDVDKKTIKILDVGCGEGVLVEKYKKEGYNIKGIDLNYQSKYVKKGNLLEMPFKPESFDIILFLDVIEHLDFKDQNTALTEIKRVLKKRGKLIISIPNLAHKASRWSFFLKGELKRTANILKHPGDRPIKEYLDLIKSANYTIDARIPIKLTLPKFSEIFYKVFLFGRYDKFIYSQKRKPNDCFLNIFILSGQKK